MVERRYKIRTRQGGRSGKQVVYFLTVPPEIARQIPPDQEFVVDWDEDGLHYSPAPPEEPMPPAPSWARR